MARPQKNTVTYFPLDCDDGKKMYYIEETYGNDGYATFIKLLKELARSEYHYLNLSKQTTVMFLSSKCKVSKEVLLSIISDLVELEKFDKELWDDSKVIWCQDFIDSIQDAYLKRKNECINRKSLLLLLDSLGVRKPHKLHHKQGLGIEKDTSNTQSKVDKIKTEEIKTEENKPNDFLLCENQKFKEIVDVFNSVCRELPIVSEITQDRKKAILDIESKYGLEKIGIVFQITSQSDYLNGKINNWKASFDWILKPVNFLKILENNYKNNGQNSNKTAEYTPSDELKEKIANRLFAKELP